MIKSQKSSSFKSMSFVITFELSFITCVMSLACMHGFVRLGHHSKLLQEKQELQLQWTPTHLKVKE